MKTIELNLYTFEELSEEAKQKAIEDNYDINVNFDWWNATYEDAENVHLKIVGFGLDRDKSCDLVLTKGFEEVLKKIIKEHGEICNTYKIAKKYLKEYNNAKYEEDRDELEESFNRDMEREYANILQDENEYLMTEEAIKETLINNDYDFLENGKIY